MKQVHDTMMSQTLLKIDNLKKKAIYLNYMKSKFTQKEISENYDANYKLVKREIELSGVKFNKKFEEVAKRSKNQNLGFIVIFILFQVIMEKAKQQLLSYYNVSDLNKNESSSEVHS